MENKKNAIEFGYLLGEDDFKRTESLLSEDCVYLIGDKKLVGPKAICGLYEQNMVAGRKKFDKLVWGEGIVESVSELAFYIHFTDFLTHKGITHVYKCKQKLSFNDAGKIIEIVHMPDEEEEKKAHAFYKKVGLE